MKYGSIHSRTMKEEIRTTKEIGIEVIDKNKMYEQ
jgi:hypothetical protein